MNFFKESKMPTYQKMWEFMSGPMKEEVMVSGNGEGIEKVVNDDGGYAFMMESSSIQVLHPKLTLFNKPECKKNRERRLETCCYRKSAFTTFSLFS